MRLLAVVTVGREARVTVRWWRRAGDQAGSLRVDWISNTCR